LCRDAGKKKEPRSDAIQRGGIKRGRDRKKRRRGKEEPDFPFLERGVSGRGARRNSPFELERAAETAKKKTVFSKIEGER